jgi:BTB/POZ domain
MPAPEPLTIATAPFDDPDADVVLCTADNVQFRVHKLFLSFASPFFRDMFKLPPPPPNSEDTDDGGRPIIPVAESSRTLRLLLNFCHPARDTTLETFEDIEEMLTVMTKYDMRDYMEAVRKQFVSPAFMGKEPLRAFAIAYRLKLKDEAILAMKESIRHPLMTPYITDLEHIPASAYHHYFTYRNLCAERVMTLVDPEIGPIWSKFTWYRYNRCGCAKESDRRNWRFWFVNYVNRVAKSLAARPCVEAATDPEWFELVTKEAECLCCTQKAHEDLAAFSRDHLLPSIRKEISEVSIRGIVH